MYNLTKLLSYKITDRELKFLLKINQLMNLKLRMQMNGVLYELNKEIIKCNELTILCYKWNSENRKTLFSLNHIMSQRISVMRWELSYCRYTVRGLEGALLRKGITKMKIWQCIDIRRSSNYKMPTVDIEINRSGIWISNITVSTFEHFYRYFSCNKRKEN